MKKKKENVPLPSPPTNVYVYMAQLHEIKAIQVQIQDTLEGLLKECKALSTKEALDTDFILKKLGAVTADLHILSVLPPSPSSPQAPQLMLRETLDKEGKVMTREYIPVPRRG